MKKKTKILRLAGRFMIICSAGVILLYGYKKISREIYLHKLLNDNINFEIPCLDIRVPVLEGTDSKALQVSAGHFEGTGAPGKGNYCIAGHNSTIYAEIFNDIDQVNIGDEMYLTDNDSDRTKYCYIVTDYTIVDPEQVDVLNDYGDNRITIISCTDDGNQRQVIVGKLK